MATTVADLKNSSILDITGDDAQNLTEHQCKTIPKENLHLPGPDFVDRIFIQSDRNNRVIGNLAWLFSAGRLAGTGYLSFCQWIRN